ncbi:MAG: twin-arginine translocation signal domain-containing protein, partial [Deltaproteobacteria bacterium]|nr:twin-arginine translocation signal domain-containing protein [Deltaproteobacteria bacterium]
MCDGTTRRDFLKHSVIGGVALGAGVGIYELAYGQATNIRFSTWHPPVGREAKTVWEPMLEELKKRSGGK